MSIISVTTIQEWSKRVRQRDNYVCQQCGSEGKEAHHILKDQELLFDLKNGITLCKKCHQQNHMTSTRYSHGLYYTISQAARLLKVRPSRINRLAVRRKNQLPTVEIDKRTLIREDDLPLVNSLLKGEPIVPDSINSTEPIPLMTITDVSEYLSFSREQVRRMLKQGELSGFKVGSRWRVAFLDLQQYLERRKQEEQQR